MSTTDDTDTLSLVSVDAFPKWQILSDDERDHMHEALLAMLDDFVAAHPHAVIQPEFEATLIDHTQELALATFCHDGVQPYDVDELEAAIDDILAEALDEFYTTLYVPRSLPCAPIGAAPNTAQIDAALAHLRSIDAQQPAQNTPEWMAMRAQMLTASIAHKIFGSQAERNQLIYEKCRIAAAAVTTAVQINPESSRHHGHRYEPVSVAIYEHMYGVSVEHFGCIPHRDYAFIGASPDGVVVSPGERYGRMLEIKNPVSRALTGTPTVDYWVQVQQQLNVCDFDAADLFETRISTYADAAAYFADTAPPTAYRGVIAYWERRDSSPTYEYYIEGVTAAAPAIEEWIAATATASATGGTLFIRHIYWKLDQWMCTYVPRNRVWFAEAEKEMAALWRIIEAERITGCEHRAPKKRATTGGLGAKGVCRIVIRRLDADGEPFEMADDGGDDAECDYGDADDADAECDYGDADDADSECDYGNADDVAAECDYGDADDAADDAPVDYVSADDADDSD